MLPPSGAYASLNWPKKDDFGSFATNPETRESKHPRETTPRQAGLRNRQRTQLSGVIRHWPSPSTGLKKCLPSQALATNSRIWQGECGGLSCRARESTRARRSSRRSVHRRAQRWGLTWQAPCAGWRHPSRHRDVAGSRRPDGCAPPMAAETVRNRPISNRHSAIRNCCKLLKRKEGCTV
jgi:hypothetical protein